MNLIWIGVGGGIGAIGRYLVGRGVAHRLDDAFPYGTFAVNVIGALLIGVTFALLAEKDIGNTQLRLFVITGLLGGFTTFSTYTLEALTLAEDGAWGAAAAYVVGSNVVGLAACAAGVLSVRSISG